MSRRRGKADWREGSAGSLAEVKSDWGKSTTLWGKEGDTVPVQLEEVGLQQLESAHPTVIRSFPNSTVPKEKPAVSRSSTGAAGRLTRATGTLVLGLTLALVSRKVSGLKSSGGPSGLAEFSPDTLTPLKVAFTYWHFILLWPHLLFL